VSLPRVFGWLADTQGCGYYRVMLPLCELARRRAADTAFDGRMFADYATGSRPGEIRVDHDGEPAVIIGQRVAQAVPSETWQLLAKADRFRLVYDIDDDLFRVDPANERAYAYFGRPDVRRRLAENLAAAHMVTVSTEPLAVQMRQYSDNVVVIGNYLDAAVLKYPRPERDGILTVGWGGSSTHGADFAAVAPHLRSFFKRRPAVRWHSFGHDYGPLTGATRRRFTRWRDIVEDQAAYCASMRWDIGVAPLADTVFNASKSDLRVREYCAAGIPAVYSRVGPYAAAVDDGVTGFLASTRKEWLAALDALAGDEGLRERMGKAAREAAAEYTIQGHGGQLWLDALGSLKW
jgi:glycosyltransferase involved in cell wall biosynthesis